MIPLVDLKAQYDQIRSEIGTAITQVLENTQFVQGDEVLAFESEFAEFCKVNYAIGVASGTAAIQIALLSCNIGAGDEVITTSHTFVATVEPIVWSGAKPVLVDIDPMTYNIAPDAVEAAITNRTKAIIPVHLYGHPVNMDPIRELSKRHGIKIIEDAAQAHGSEYKNHKVGSIGNVACFSFYPGKNLGAYGDAGMITTNDPQIAENARRLRDHGRNGKYSHLQVGLGERLDTLQAAILRVKLNHLEKWTEKRRTAAINYSDLLTNLPVTAPSEENYARHVYHLYAIRVSKRDLVMRSMQQKGIGVGVHYPIPVHLQQAFSYLGYQHGDLIHTERASEEVLSLPLYPELTYEQQQKVVSALQESL